MILNEKLFNAPTLVENVMDGWEEIDEAPIINELEKFTYELRNARRGVYTKAITYQQLATYVEGLAEQLEDFADLIRTHQDEDEEE